ncbi:type VII secretion integral membrane protein EccD [Rhizomonospora bruguierae]|uniref:type VII secretion integral membrane protein EccD n=1 Tax=Rhizomonospora bruguierae TaxID=1581705 RepID=UPI001BCD9043|nr:type VII secretion integral membrane protein EccD [Micromonospora sp. NBRC 107566]
MSAPTGLGLARVTIAAPGRRIDIALPEHLPLAELMPTLLHHLGEGMRDAEADTSGWNLCRTDGSRLLYQRSLAAQQVRDGEVLHLATREKDWPEPDYDDLVLAVAEGTRRLGPAWHGGLTRSAAVAGAAAGLLVGLVVLALSGPPWPGAALGALVVALVTLVTGTVLSRAAADAGAGAAIAAAGLPYAFVGGALLLAGTSGRAALGPAHLLAGAAVLLLASVIGFFGVADRLWLFVAGVVAALHAALAALLALTPLDAVGAAAGVVCVALLVMPLSALLSVRLARLPMPDLPQNAQELLADKPLPPREHVFATVARADEVFAGMLLGTAVTALAAQAYLVFGGPSARLLAAIVAVLLLIRSRSLTRPRHRAPLLVSGALGLSFGAAAIVLSQPQSVRPILVAAVLLPIALAVVAAGARYSRRRPSPQLARLVDALEFVLAIAVVPVALVVLGLFAYVRSLAG